MAEIRRLTPSDAAALLPLIRAHAAFERGEASCSQEQLEAALVGDSPRLTGWLAACADAPVGYATASRDFSTWSGEDFLHLDCLFVIAERRGQGIGRLLLATAVDYGRTLGLRRLEWQTPDWNTSAARFYRRAGASESAKRRFILGTGP